ncbi:mll7904 [Mesorhizobium japonicum MAFF 303099]|uniref:Mll7904 protein n=1 Tax=Mesorhizobium japonicum (strain LMG 29417 / CECT 9101 / MAFF 303099) TaxID=266835 RepID=Q984P8_RHILO|nr:mll7904 [Mesorhizobium japonicum MAFF 303099]
MIGFLFAGAQCRLDRRLRSTARARKNSSQKPLAVSAPDITDKPADWYAGTTSERRRQVDGIQTCIRISRTQASHPGLRRPRQSRQSKGRARQPTGASLCLPPRSHPRCSALRAEPAAGQLRSRASERPCGYATPQRPVYFLAGAFAFAGAALAFGAAAFFTAGFVAAAAAFAAGFAAAFAAGFAAAFAAGFAAALAGAAFLAAGFAAALAAGFFAGAALAAGFAAALAGAAFFTAGFAAALAAAGFLAGAALAAGFAAAFAGAAFFTAVAAFAATAFAGAFFAGTLDAGALDDCLAMSCPFTLCRWP